MLAHTVFAGPSCCFPASPWNLYKKLIRRWDSERELSLRRHRTRNDSDTKISIAWVGCTNVRQNRRQTDGRMTTILSSRSLKIISRKYFKTQNTSLPRYGPVFRLQLWALINDCGISLQIIFFCILFLCKFGDAAAVLFVEVTRL